MVKKILAIKLIVLILISNFYFLNFNYVNAAINPEINYQGRLLDSAGDAVVDAGYNIQFKLYTVSSGGSPIWTETYCYSNDNGATCTGSGSDNRVDTTNGLFSVMLGSLSSLENIDFNQDLYLGVNIGGTASTPSYDGEMTPRKKLGTVPAAFESARLNGITSDQFFRNDIVNATNSATTSLAIRQDGAGKVAEFFGSTGNSLFTVQSNGNVGIGTSTPASVFNVYDNQFGWNLRYGGDANVNRLGWYNGANLQMWIDGNNTGNTSQIGFFSSRLDIGSNAISITNGSDVGIGTTSPTHKFAVSGGDVFFGNGSDTKLYLGDTSNYFQTNGDLQAFASDSMRFNANGGAVFFQNNGGAKFQLGGTREGDSDIFVTDTGNLGVGTSSSAVKFAVEGDAFVSGGLYDSNFTKGTNGYVLQTTGSGIQWVATSTLGITGGGGSSTPVTFRVHRNGSAQAVTNGVYTKIDWTTESFDTNSDFDLSTDRFTPTVAGYYQVNSTVYCTAAATSCYTAIYKNGTGIAYSGLSAGTSIMPTVTQVIYMNGSTDYLESYVYAAGTAIFGESEWTNFSGTLISNDSAEGANYIAGTNTEIQFNDGGTFGTDSAFTFDKTTDTLNVNGSVTGVIGDAAYSIGTTGISLTDDAVPSSLSLTSNTLSFTSGSDYAHLSPNYLNFGSTVGSSGFGIRNNGGTIEYKNSGGSWTALTAIDAGGTLTDSDYFESNDFVNNTTAQFDPFTAAAISSGTLSTPLSTAMTTGQTPGVVRLRSSTTANGGYRITTPAGYLLLDDNMMFEGVMQLQTSTNVTVRLGFHDSTSSSDAVDGVYFEIIGGTVTGKTSNNSTRSSTASNYAITAGGANWYKFRVVLNSNASTATYYIYNLSGTQLWTDSLSTNIPTAVGRETAAGIVATESSTTATDMVHVDYMGIGTVAGYDSVNSSGAGLWTTSGSDAYYNLGKIGIGTATPQRKLHVYTASDEAPVRFEDSNGYCEINPTSTTWTCTSDERLKDNILDVASSTPDLYEKMRLLRPVTFEWKSDETNTTRVGFIAQEVEAIFPDFVTTDPETGLKAVSYGAFIPYVIYMVQNLATQAEELAKAIDEITGEGINSMAGFVSKLTVGTSEKPSGITLFDESTGDPYCLSVKNGNMVTKFGECGEDEQTTGNSVDEPILVEDTFDIGFDIEESPEQDIIFEETPADAPSVEQNVQPEESEIENVTFVETNESSGSVELPL